MKVTRIEGREKRSVAACIIYAIGVAYSYVCGDVQHRSATAVLRGFRQVCGGGGGDGSNGNGDSSSDSGGSIGGVGSSGSSGGGRREDIH